MSVVEDNKFFYIGMEGSSTDSSWVAVVDKSCSFVRLRFCR